MKRYLALAGIATFVLAGVLLIAGVVDTATATGMFFIAWGVWFASQVK